MDTTQVGTLVELEVQSGDIVECVEDAVEYFVEGDQYKITRNKTIARKPPLRPIDIEDVGLSKFRIVGRAAPSATPYTPGERQAVAERPTLSDMLKTDLTAEDVVVKPKHYVGFAIEPITFIMRNKLPFWKGNIIKYACRAGRKVYDGMTPEQSEITDLEKVRRYAEMRINELKGCDEL